MSEINSKTTKNGLVISEEVISKIVTVAAKEVPGVKDVVTRSTDLKNILNKDRSFKAVRIQNGDNTFVIDVNLLLKAGARIIDVAEKVQSHVKESVQNMTGFVVTKVNVNIEDIDLTEPGEKEN